MVNIVGYQDHNQKSREFTLNFFDTLHSFGVIQKEKWHFQLTTSPKNKRKQLTNVSIPGRNGQADCCDRSDESALGPLTYSRFACINTGNVVSCWAQGDSGHKNRQLPASKHGSGGKGRTAGAMFHIPLSAQIPKSHPELSRLTALIYFLSKFLHNRPYKQPSSHQ